MQCTIFSVIVLFSLIALFEYSMGQDMLVYGKFKHKQGYDLDPSWIVNKGYQGIGIQQSSRLQQIPDLYSDTLNYNQEAFSYDSQNDKYSGLALI